MTIKNLFLISGTVILLSFILGYSVLQVTNMITKAQNQIYVEGPLL